MGDPCSNWVIESVERPQNGSTADVSPRTALRSHRVFWRCARLMPGCNMAILFRCYERYGSSINSQSIRRLFLAGRVVCRQVADGVLDTGENRCHDRGDGIDVFAVAESLIKDAALAFAVNPTQRVVAVCAAGGCGLQGLIGRRHLCVVDAGEDVHVLAGKGVRCKGIDLVMDAEFRSVGGYQRLVDGVLRIVKLDGDALRVVPVPFEEAADHLVELRPCGFQIRGAHRKRVMIRVAGGVQGDEAFARADEAYQRVLTGLGCDRIVRVVQEELSRVGEHDGVVFGEVGGVDVSGVIGDVCGVRARLFSMALTVVAMRGMAV